MARILSDAYGGLLVLAPLEIIASRVEKHQSDWYGRLEKKKNPSSMLEAAMQSAVPAKLHITGTAFGDIVNPKGCGLRNERGFTGTIDAGPVHRLAPQDDCLIRLVCQAVRLHCDHSGDAS